MARSRNSWQVKTTEVFDLQIVPKVTIPHPVHRGGSKAMKKNFWYTVGCVILLLAGGSVWFFLTVGENDTPGIVVEGDPVMIGKQKLLTATFSDRGTGLRRTEIVITQDSRPRVVSSIDYPEKGIRNKPVSVALDAAALKLHDGPATLTLTAVDHSLWNNRTVVERPATIDFLPPQIFQLNPAEPHQSGRRLCRGLSPVRDGILDGRPGRRPVLPRLSGHACRETRLCCLLRPASGCDTGLPADPHHGAGSGGKRNRRAASPP